jgi:transposase
MGRKQLEISSLYGQDIKELIELKNNTDSKYTRLVLGVITMRYLGAKTKDIMLSTGLSNPSVVKHIAEWNSKGMDAIQDHRGGSVNKLEPEIVDDILYIIINKSPIDFNLTAHTWSCALLANYVEQKYGVKVCIETIRQVLISNGLSYKRAQPKPTKADKKEQETFKKNAKPTKYFRVFT